MGTCHCYQKLTNLIVLLTFGTKNLVTPRGCRAIDIIKPAGPDQAELVRSYSQRNDPMK